MKFTTTAALAVAPLALAKAVNNVYPAARDLTRRGGDRGRGGDSRGNGRGDSGNVIQVNNLQQVEVSEIIILWVNPGGGSGTTTLNSIVTVTKTVTAGEAGSSQAGVAQGGNGQGNAQGGNGQGTNTVGSAASGTVAGTGTTHTVMVGGAAGLVYSPDNIQAAIGDSVVFTFMASNHTVTQSAFDKPCEALAGGMDSGFQSNPNNTISPAPQFAMQVMVDTPLWFYCRQKGHCGKGMAFSINPTAAKTQAMFQAMAISQNGTGSASAIVGGQAPPPAEGAPPPPAEAAPPAQGASSVVAEGASLTATLGGVATETATAEGVASSGVVSGTGTLNGDGSCACAVFCGVGSFPAVAQGAGSFGGFAGALPMTTAV